MGPATPRVHLPRDNPAVVLAGSCDAREALTHTITWHNAIFKKGGGEDGSRSLSQRLKPLSTDVHYVRPKRHRDHLQKGHPLPTINRPDPEATHSDSLSIQKCDLPRPRPGTFCPVFHAPLPTVPDPHKPGYPGTWLPRHLAMATPLARNAPSKACTHTLWTMPDSSQYEGIP